MSQLLIIITKRELFSGAAIPAMAVAVGNLGPASKLPLSQRKDPLPIHVRHSSRMSMGSHSLLSLGLAQGPGKAEESLLPGGQKAPLMEARCHGCLNSQHPPHTCFHSYTIKLQGPYRDATSM